MDGTHVKQKRLRPRTLRRIIAFAACIILILAALCIKSAIVKSVNGQDIAEKWQAGDIRYTQISNFIDIDVNLDENTIRRVRSAVDSALEQESIASENEDARLWIDAYSGETKVSVSRNSTTVEARAICVGGDFFYFHELDLMDGWYFSKDDIMKDTIIVDRELAWQVFGAFELSGMNVNVNGYTCKIVAVSRTPESGAEKDTYGTEATLFMSFDLLEKLGLADTVPITCYETVIPDPVTGFGTGIINEALGLEKSDIVTIENTYRYNLKNCVMGLKDFASSSMRVNKVFYPYWENAALYAESWCILLTAFMMFFAIYPVICVAVCFIYAILNRSVIFKQVAAWAKCISIKIKSMKGKHKAGKKEKDGIEPEAEPEAKMEENENEK